MLTKVRANIKQGVSEYKPGLFLTPLEFGSTHYIFQLTISIKTHTLLYLRFLTVPLGHCFALHFTAGQTSRFLHLGQPSQRVPSSFKTQRLPDYKTVIGHQKRLMIVTSTEWPKYVRS